MRKGLIILTFGLIVQAGFSQKMIEKDFKKHFDKYGVKGCFALYNQADNEYIKYNPNLCDSGYIPASTFKIPNSLITLEEGIVKDTNQIIKWNGRQWPHKSWNQDQTLKTAMKHSCIWVYFGFAEQIGVKKYQDYINSFEYGNKNLTGPPSRFWLAGLFRISANQQIEFLRKFYHNNLPKISRHSIDIVKDIIVIEQTDNYKFSGKTGGGMLTDTDYIMWLVGYVEKNNNPCFYAMNFKTNDYNSTSQARYNITKDVLRELKLIE